MSVPPARANARSSAMPFGKSVLYTEFWLAAARAYAPMNCCASSGMSTSRPGGTGRPGVNVSNTVIVDVSATCLSTSSLTSVLNGAPSGSSAAIVC